jgi:HTH-type transcriptional regulator/antitoxin HigA
MVLCPSFPGTKAHGATFWLGREKAVLMLSLRGKWADIFWFSLFHELGHLLLHDRQTVFIEDDETAPDMQTKEAEADRFAADHLIPPRQYALFAGRRLFDPGAIKAFATSIGIDPGIVVGRLQHDGHLKNEWRNDLRTRYEWSQSATA